MSIAAAEVTGMFEASQEDGRATAIRVAHQDHKAHEATQFALVVILVLRVYVTRACPVKGERRTGVKEKAGRSKERPAFLMNREPTRTTSVRRCGSGEAPAPLPEC